MPGIVNELRRAAGLALEVTLQDGTTLSADAVPVTGATASVIASTEHIYYVAESAQPSAIRSPALPIGNGSPIVANDADNYADRPASFHLVAFEGNPHEYFEEGTVFEDQKGQWKESSPMLLLQRLELRRRLLEKRIKAMINSHK